MKKRTDGKYQKQITIIVDGVKKQKCFYGRTIAEINQKTLNYKGEIENGQLFENVVEEWERDHYKTITYGTMRSYKAAKDRLVKRFKGRHIKDIKPNDIKLFILDFASNGYAQKTVKNLLLVASLIFSYAVNKNYISYSPTEHIKVPKNLPKKRREIPTAEEITAVKNSLNCPFGLFAFLLLHTGCRKGEALALQYKDIDTENNLISINKSVFYIGNKAELKQPKTQAGNREIFLLEPLKNALLIGEKERYIFSDDDGLNPMTAKSFIVKWKKYQTETGLIITPHQLRHAYATRLYELGIDEKSAQELMGHADIATLRNIYTHISEIKKQSVASQMKDF